MFEQHIPPENKSLLTESQAESFAWYYSDPEKDEQQLRIWIRNNDIWTEHQQGGSSRQFKVKERIKLPRGYDGTIVAPFNDPIQGMEIFIPDKNSAEMWLWVRWDKSFYPWQHGEWIFIGSMIRINDVYQNEKKTKQILYQYLNEKDALPPKELPLIKKDNQNKNLVEVRNLIGEGHLINNDFWAVSLVRKKEGKGEQHAFIIIEGFKDGKYQIYKAELLLNMNESYSSGSGKSIISFLPNNDKIVTKDFLQKLNGNYLNRSWGITASEAESLIKDIQLDMERNDIRYNKAGNGSAYSSRYSGERYHNCLSWAKEKLLNLNLNIENKWTDFLFLDPKDYLPDISKNNKDSCCTIF